ncbi:cation transporter [Candidatus Bipolaricaulota bacterium]|nr:cation transporter [Candidatus Bipolaricaulota bacterium]TFH07608.1 MAG: cation transporter [Candidatus Atribacteria bacterium]
MSQAHSIRTSRDPGARVTIVGIVWNILLLGVKLIVGFFTGSAGLIADGIHSGSDMATDLAVLGGMHLARRKADADHPYGHGRFETLAGGIVAGVLILVGGFISWEGIVALYRAVHSFPGPAVMCVAAASIGVKEWMYRRTVTVARSVGSAALHANAWHHRSDAMSSIAVLAGGVGSLIGWGHADQLASIIVGLMVVAAGGKTLVAVLHELTEGGLAQDELSKIEDAIESVDGTREWHDLRTRRVGRETFIDLHVLVNPGLSIVDAHRISSDVEGALRRACDHPANVTVHVEPDLEELRKREER